ncbi:MAG: prepilin-type N-terminal cleavage/methylation domain-containing protein [Nitrospirae bacterium]|nr:MAG: prepilin-type N-terminal cleavage/methylation domain-containing protein [Nitrospirota bacterium]
MRRWRCFTITGYTILELMIVVAIAGILITLAIPSFQRSAIKAKEAALKQNLFTIRTVIDQYYADRGTYPPTLNTLVEKGYLREIPIDPFTQSATTWQIVYEEQEEYEGEPAGVYDVKSGSDQIALDGTRYSEW